MKKLKMKILTWFYCKIALKLLSTKSWNDWLKETIKQPIEEHPKEVTTFLLRVHKFAMSDWFHWWVADSPDILADSTAKALETYKRGEEREKAYSDRWPNPLSLVGTIDLTNYNDLMPKHFNESYGAFYNELPPECKEQDPEKHKVITASSDEDDT